MQKIVLYVFLVYLVIAFSTSTVLKKKIPFQDLYIILVEVAVLHNGTAFFCFANCALVKKNYVKQGSGLRSSRERGPYSS